MHRSRIAPLPHRIRKSPVVVQIGQHVRRERPLYRALALRAKPARADGSMCGRLVRGTHCVYVCVCVCVRLRRQQQISPYFNPTYTRTGWLGQPPVLDRHEVVTIDGDVDTLRQATP